MSALPAPSRRGVALGLAALATLRVGGVAAAGGLAGLPERWAAIGREIGGRLGVAAIDLATGEAVELRGAERFPLLSTFKLLAAAAILERVGRGAESLDRRIRFEQAELVEYSPATSKRVGGEGMTLAELCEAALTLSDNTAGNLLLDALGGPAAIGAYARTLGDDQTRLDRTEPTLNEAAAGDPRDTTTPGSMARDLRRLVLGDALPTAQRQVLTGWLKANRTGDARIRAGVPAGWTVGDKTGSGDNGTANDVGVLWRPDGRTLVLAIYLTGTRATPEARNAAIAAVARVTAAAAV